MDSPLLIIVQARMESARLPGKILAPILGQPMLLHMLDRLRELSFPHRLMLALADTEASRNVAQPLLQRHGYTATIPLTSPDDVLARYVLALHEAQHIWQLPFSTVIRLTADCPLIDPHVIAALVTHYRQASVVYAALAHEWADGLDAEVINSATLCQIHAETTDAFAREHVTPALWQQPSRFPQSVLPCPLNLSRHNWSVDTPHDLAFARQVYEALYPLHGPRFGWRDVYALLAKQLPLPRDERNGAYVAQVGAENWEALRYGNVAGG